MTSIEGAISDDYDDYRYYCQSKNIKNPLSKYGPENFYKTKEWEEIQKIPHFRGCLGMALDELALKSNPKI